MRPGLPRWLKPLASLRLTTAGFVALGALVLVGQFDARLPGWMPALPMAVLAANLSAALLTHPRLRRGGLGLFHLALLGCLLLLAWGRLTHFEGRVELTQGATFDPAAVEVLSVGPWHGERWRRLQFGQGRIEVRYAPGLKRARTISEVSQATSSGEVTGPVGDDHPLKLDGFRFYTTHNKGFAPLLTWQPAAGPALTGAVHLPAYPLFEAQQQQRWQPPGGPELRLWLRLPPLADEQRAWQLQPDQVAAMLVVELQGRRFELHPGDEASGPAGRLRYERLLGWMGYRIHHDPTLAALWWLACLGVLGLARHFWPLIVGDMPESARPPAGWAAARGREAAT